MELRADAMLLRRYMLDMDEEEKERLRELKDQLRLCLYCRTLFWRDYVEAEGFDCPLCFPDGEAQACDRKGQGKRKGKSVKGVKGSKGKGHGKGKGDKGVKSVKAYNGKGQGKGKGKQ